jgi:histidinol-phosphate aminotransferase
VRQISAERAALTAALRERRFEVTDSQANFLWVAHPSVDGGELVSRLARAGVLVAGGDALGDSRHVRIGLRDAACSERLVGALDKALL